MVWIKVNNIFRMWFSEEFESIFEDIDTENSSNNWTNACSLDYLLDKACEPHTTKVRQTKLITLKKSTLCLWKKTCFFSLEVATKFREPSQPEHPLSQTFSEGSLEVDQQNVPEDKNEVHGRSSKSKKKKTETIELNHIPSRREGKLQRRENI